jgi:hypothetical protein
MALYYIPGATTPAGISQDYYDDSEPFILADVQYPASWPKDSVMGATICVHAPCTLDGTAFVIAEVRNGASISYVGTARDLAEVAALQKQNADGILFGKIAALEGSITDRMWREDSAHSTAVMNFPQQKDALGNLLPADPRNGLTSSQYIAWVDAQIATLRTGLR